MKKLFTILIVMLSLTINAQLEFTSNVSISNNQYIDSNGVITTFIGNTNCGNIYNGTIKFLGGLNLNSNSTLYIKGNIEIYGYFNGPGSIQSCNNGQGNQLSVCYTNAIVQNNPNVNNLQCDATLDLPTFDLMKDFGYNYVLYELESGKILLTGITHKDMFLEFPKGKLILVVETFKPWKFFKT